MISNSSGSPSRVRLTSIIRHHSTRDLETIIFEVLAAIIRRRFTTIPPRIPAAPMLASRAQRNPIRGHRMTRIAIINRAEMNSEQGRVYDMAKATSGIVSGPYYAYIRLPKVFEASQHLRAALSSGPLSRREHQIV